MGESDVSGRVMAPLYDAMVDGPPGTTSGTPLSPWQEFIVPRSYPAHTWPSVTRPGYRSRTSRCR